MLKLFLRYLWKMYFFLVAVFVFYMLLANWHIGGVPVFK